MSELVHRIRGGADYFELLLAEPTQHVSTAIISRTEKLVYPDARFSIDLVLSSWKYGSELQFKAFSTEAPFKASRTDKEHRFYRLECGYLPGNHETAERLRRIADQIDELTGYRDHVHVRAAPRRQIQRPEDVLC
jgi:hypothetical protein